MLYNTVMLSKHKVGSTSDAVMRFIQHNELSPVLTIMYHLNETLPVYLTI